MFHTNFCIFSCFSATGVKMMTISKLTIVFPSDVFLFSWPHCVTMSLLLYSKKRTARHRPRCLHLLKHAVQHGVIAQAVLIKFSRWKRVQWRHDFHSYIFYCKGGFLENCHVIQRQRKKQIYRKSFGDDILIITEKKTATQSAR